MNERAIELKSDVKLSPALSDVVFRYALSRISRWQDEPLLSPGQPGGNGWALGVILGLGGSYKSKVSIEESEFRQFILQPLFPWYLLWFNYINLGGSKVSAHRKKLSLNLRIQSYAWQHLSSTNKGRNKTFQY